MNENKIIFNLELFPKGDNLRKSLISQFENLNLVDLITELTNNPKQQNRFIVKYKSFLNNSFYRNIKANRGILNSTELKAMYFGLEYNFDNLFSIEELDYNNPVDFKDWFIGIFAAIAMSRAGEKFVVNSSISNILKNIVLTKLNTIYFYNRIFEGIDNPSKFEITFDKKVISDELSLDYIKNIKLDEFDKLNIKFKK